jgi:hypothetical protein
MSISITLPDDARPQELQAAEQFFRALVAARQAEIDEYEKVVVPQLQKAALTTHARIGDTHAHEAQPGTFGRIAPEDNPETGVEPTVTAPQAEDTAPTAEDAAAAFGTPVPPPLPTITAAGAAVGLPVQQDDSGAPEMDKTGLPWDERIHSGGANKLNADGAWRKRRGVSEIDYKRIEAELRGTPPAPQVPPPPATVPTLAVVPPAPFVPPAAPSVPPPPTVSASPAVPPVGSAPATFAQIAGMIGPLMAPKGNLTQEMIGRAMQAHGLGPGLPLLAASQDKIPAVWASIQNLLNGGQP